MDLLASHLGYLDTLWSNHLKIHRGWSQRRQFLRHALKKNMVALWQHGIGVQNYADVDVTLHDAGRKCRGSAGFMTSGIWLERHCNAMETFDANSDVVSVRKPVGLLVYCAEDANSVPL